MIKFFKSVGQTMKKVTWPTYKQNQHDTAVVVVTSLLFGLYLGLLDLLFSYMVRLFL